jgi:hypothetical protein
MNLIFLRLQTIHLHHLREGFSVCLLGASTQTARTVTDPISSRVASEYAPYLDDFSRVHVVLLSRSRISCCAGLRLRFLPILIGDEGSSSPRVATVFVVKDRHASVVNVILFAFEKFAISLFFNAACC